MRVPFECSTKRLTEQEGSIRLAAKSRTKGDAELICSQSPSREPLGRLLRPGGGAGWSASLRSIGGAVSEQRRVTSQPAAWAGLVERCWPLATARRHLLGYTGPPDSKNAGLGPTIDDPHGVWSMGPVLE